MSVKDAPLDGNNEAVTVCDPVGVVSLQLRDDNGRLLVVGHGKIDW